VGRRRWSGGPRQPPAGGRRVFGLMICVLFCKRDPSDPADWRGRSQSERSFLFFLCESFHCYRFRAERQGQTPELSGAATVAKHGVPEALTRPGPDGSGVMALRSWLAARNDDEKGRRANSVFLSPDNLALPTPEGSPAPIRRRDTANSTYPRPAYNAVRGRRPLASTIFDITTLKPRPTAPGRRGLSAY
jgi:hypothetical protein